MRHGGNAHWVAEGDLLAFDRVGGGEVVRCLFNFGGAPIAVAALTAGGAPLVALGNADNAMLPPCGALWLQMKG